MTDWKGRANTALHETLRRLPTGVVSLIGAGLGELSGRGRGSGRRERAGATVARFGAAAHPEPAGWGWCRHMGRTLAELATLDRLWAEGRIEVQGAEHLDSGGRPLLIAGVHTGNWEVVGLTLAGLGRAPAIIYAPPGNPAEHALVVAARRRYGARLIAPSPIAAREALRTLEARRQPLLVYVDEWKHGRVHGPALGRPLLAEGNIATVVRLAARTGALVVPVIPERLSGARFRVRFLPGMLVPSKQPLMTGIARLDAAIEPEVRRLMAQWLMAYVWPLQDRAGNERALPSQTHPPGN